jgi:hypothetical protein
MSDHAASDPVAQLRALEILLLQPHTRTSPEALANLLTDDFREFGASGRIYTKLEIIAALAAESPSTITLTEFDCRFPAPTVALVTYRSHHADATGTPASALRSSLWIHRDGRWQMLFHQGTRI